jgi:hypothetical protein
MGLGKYRVSRGPSDAAMQQPVKNITRQRIRPISAASALILT